MQVSPRHNEIYPRTISLFYHDQFLRLVIVILNLAMRSKLYQWVVGGLRRLSNEDNTVGFLNFQITADHDVLSTDVWGLSMPMPLFAALYGNQKTDKEWGSI